MATQITVEQAKTMVEGGAAIFLDVREKEEIEFASVEPFTWIPMAQLAARKDELPIDKEIVCICRSGHRSASAAEFLSRNGFRAVNMKGGLLEWGRKIDPKVRPYVYSYSGNKIAIKEL